MRGFRPGVASDRGGGGGGESGRKIPFLGVDGRQSIAMTAGAAQAPLELWKKSGAGSVDTVERWYSVLKGGYELRVRW